MRGSLSRLIDRNPHISGLVRGATSAVLLRLSAVGIQFGFNLLLARLVGVEGTGIYYLALVVSVMAALIGRVGLDDVLVRCTSVHAESESWTQIAGLAQFGFRLATWVGLAATAVVMVSAPSIAESIFSEPDLAAPLRLMALSIVPFALLSLYGSLLAALKMAGRAVLVQMTGVPLISFGLLGFLGTRYGVNGAVAAYVLACALVLVLARVLWRQAAPRAHFKHETPVRGEVLRSCLPLLWLNLMLAALMWADALLLGVWGSATDVGIYAIAKRVAIVLGLVTYAVSISAPPRFATLYDQGRVGELERLARTTLCLMGLLGLPVLVVLVAFPDWVLGWFGDDFRAGAELLTVLALGQFATFLHVVNAKLLIMAGRERLVGGVVTVVADANIALNCVLIPEYGAMGAAIAYTLSHTAMSVTSTVVLKAKLSIALLPHPRRLP